MVQRPQSPTSLLWARKLKQEHGFLLNRQSSVEEKFETFDAKISTIERVAHEAKAASKRIADIDNDFKKLSEGELMLNRRIGEHEKKVDEALKESHHAMSEISRQMATFRRELGTLIKAYDETRQGAAKKESSLTKHLQMVEASLMDASNAQEQLARQLMGFDQRGMRAMQDAIVQQQRTILTVEARLQQLEQRLPPSTPIDAEWPKTPQVNETSSPAQRDSSPLGDREAPRR
jgi:ABC-type transporter Mla subunit MlaD